MTALIGIGSNLNPENHILSGIRELKTRFTMTGVSPFYQTKPLKGLDQPDYLNGLAQLENITQSQSEIIETLHDIENLCGRIRDSEDRYASRTLDLDLLAIDNQAIDPADFTQRPFNWAAANKLCPGLVLEIHSDQEILRVSDYIPPGLNQNDLIPRPDFDILIHKEIAHE